MTTQKATTYRAIEAWFEAHEAHLADPSQEREGLSRDQSTTLMDAARECGADWGMPTAPDGIFYPAELPEMASIILGQTAGACFVKKPAVQGLQAAERIVSSTAGWAAFSASAAAEISLDHRKLVALETCLLQIVHAFTWAPRRAVNVFRDNMCALAERYRLQPRLEDLWSGQNSRIFFVRHEPAFDALRLSDPSSYLKLLEAFPHPDPSRLILDCAADRMDLNGLLALLALARPCFADGCWLPCVKTPILIVAAIEEKLATLARMDDDCSSEPSAAFICAIRQVIGCVLERSDGNSLGHAWLQWLIERRALGTRRRPREDRSQPDHYLRLLFNLTFALSPRLDAITWIGSERDVWRRNRAVAALAAAGLGKTEGHDAAAKLMWKVLQLGLWSVAQEDHFSASLSPERHLMAAIIGRCTAPAAWFDKLWCDLAPFRDRARHITALAGGHASDTTLIAVGWFLFGLDAIDMRAPEHTALWRSLHAAVREGDVAQASPTVEAAWRMRHKFLAARLGTRLLIVADEAAEHDLQDLLGPLLALDIVLAEVIALLFDAGVAPKVIAAGSGRSVHLVKLLRRLETEQAWREAVQGEQIGRQSQFSNKIAWMADMIEESF